MEDKEEEEQGTYNEGKIFHLPQDFLFLFDSLFVYLMGWCDYLLLRHNNLQQV